MYESWGVPLVRRSFRLPDKTTTESSWIDGVMSQPRLVASLQEQCRRSILARLSIRHVQQVARLPLPYVVKDFLTTFRIPGDFDLSGMYIDYNFNFPYHAHHRTHQIHPGVCQLDGMQILIKCSTDLPCELCGTDQLDFRRSQKEREIWKSLKHKNLQNCLLSDVKNMHNMTCYVLEFPLMSILDYAYKVFLAGSTVPEFLVWETLLKLTSVFLYLETEKVEAWDLCQPEHVVIDDQGEIKLENLLLYLPGRSLIKPRRNVGTPFRAPVRFDSSNTETIVWGIGNVIAHLIAPVPSVLMKDKCTGLSVSPALRERACKTPYSRKLQNILNWCLRDSPALRPSLSKLGAISGRMLKKFKPSYDGPSNLLELISNDKI